MCIFLLLGRKTIQADIPSSSVYGRMDGTRGWGPEWEKDLRYQNESLVTEVLLKNEALGLELRCSDVVDFELNIYIKKIEIRNLQDTSPPSSTLFQS